MNIFANFLLGISLAAPLGPASTVIIRNGLKHGFIGGIVTALGVVSADLTYLLIVYFGLSSFIGIPLVKMGLWIFGALVLIYLGYQSIREYFSKINMNKFDDRKTTNLFLHGYSVNISNPLAVVFWAGIYGSILASQGSSLSGTWGLLLSLTIIIGILIWHTFLSFLTFWGNRFFKEKYFKYIALISGLTLIWYGLTFAYKAFVFVNN